MDKSAAILREAFSKKKTSLNLSKCNLEEIPSEIQEMPWLRKLNLSNNSIRSIRSLDNLTGLESLDLRRNKISKMEGLENLVSLEKLDLSNNRIQK